MSKSIEFSTAKLAKEKGFDKIQHSGLGFSMYNSIGDKITSSEYFEKEKKYCFLRPSQTNLQKWLRERHKLHCCVSPYEDNDELLFEGTVVEESDWSIHPLSGYASHEEALEEILYEALNLI
jgi:hypothetical protein